MDSSDEPPLEQLFPKLAWAGYEITSPATRQYNCAAWAAGYNDVPWDHGAVLYAYWPRRVSRDGSTGSLVAVFAALGYTRCDNGDLEEGLEKIAIYDNANDDWTHAARQLADGSWTSKLGGREDIRRHARRFQGREVIPRWAPRCSFWTRSTSICRSSSYLGERSNGRRSGLRVPVA